MKKTIKLLASILLLGCAQLATAQCGAAAENCFEAVCLFSKTELETGWSSGGYTGDAPPPNYCSQVQNDQWFAFVAADNAVQLTITPSNCVNGDGLQAAIYSDCNLSPLVCNPSSAGSGNVPSVLPFAADSGTVYYLMVDGYSGDVCDFTISAIGVSDNPLSLKLGLIEGKVLWDINQDCLPDSADQAVADVTVHFAGIKQLTRTSKADGSFKFLYSDSSAVVISIADIPGNYWAPCENAYVVNPDSLPDTTQVNFLLTPSVLCAYLQVDLSMPPFFRPCTSSGTAVKYSNTGTLAAENAYIEVAVPAGLTIDSTSIPIAAQYGDTLRFELGTVQPFQSETFVIYFGISCDASQIGQTKCISAHIYPDTVCPGWSKAHIELSASCIGDSTVRFKLRNTGLEQNSPDLEYIIIEDEVVLHNGVYNLAPSDSMIIEKSANGATWRMQAEQEPGHPGHSMPAMSLEGCGGLVSTGLVNAFWLDDADDFVDIDCSPVVGSFDPNLKIASPAGLGASHRIEANIPIEYSIHFQNTGTDTAFSVRLLDTLPNALEVLSFRPGASSHPCTWQILDDRILEVMFFPIALPDSNVNERASHGWFEYRLDQKADLPIGTYFENRAAIYFDYNDPVLTEAAWHTVGKLLVSIQEPAGLERSPWRVMGNPLQTTCTFQAQTPIVGRSRFELTDARGNRVRSVEFSGQQYTFNRGDLPSGTYFFSLQTAQNGLTSGKILVQD